jgi:hypothetical protein
MPPGRSSPLLPTCRGRRWDAFLKGSRNYGVRSEGWCWFCMFVVWAAPPLTVSSPLLEALC